MIAQLDGHFWWYLTRASGLVSWVLLSAAVLWGLLYSSRMIPKRSAPKWLLDLHRFLGGLATLFVAIHLTSLVADSYVHFGAADLLVPFASSWRPVAVAWGVLALYLLLAVEITSLAMRRLPRRFWRAVHGSSFVLFVVSTVHMFTAGADAHNVVLLVATAGIVTAVMFALAYRILVAISPVPRMTVLVSEARPPGRASPTRTAGR